MKNKYTKIFFAIILSFLFLPALTQAAGYDFFVDKNSAAASEDGSEQYPWKTISAALAHIGSGGLKDKAVYIKRGTYAESINIVNDAQLIGEDDAETILDSSGHHNAINFVSTKSELHNITVKNAVRTNIIVGKRSKATIANCNVENAGNFGIEIEDSSATNKYKFTLKDAKISESGSQGIYVGKRKISLSGNEISDNDEEGMDLHQGVKGSVSGNDILRNGESGIEMILSGASLTFKGNKVEDNRTQGISVQIYSTKKKGKVKISRNTINGNSGYGVRYANYTHSIGPNKLKVFVAKYVKLSQNTISGNNKGKYSYE